MRITEGMRIHTALAAEETASERLNTATQVASSGLRVGAPSDDPVAFAQGQSIDARISVLQGRATAASRASSDLDLADSVFDSASNVMVQAKQLALQASNDTMSPTDRAAMASSASNLASELMSLANTKGTSGYLFGGTKNDTPPFASDGSFVGNDKPSYIEVADGVTTRTNASGAQAFTAAGGRDIVGDLKALASALASNDTSTIQSLVGSFDTDGQQITSARTDAGLNAERLQSAQSVIATAVTSAQTSHANLVEADAVTSYSDLQTAQNAYERGVAVTRQILSLDSMSAS